MVTREVHAGDRRPIEGLCEVLRDSVHGGASIGFLQPLSPSSALAYWEQVYESLGASLRLWVAEQGDSVVGTVQLAPCMRENGRHRADLMKLLVHSGFRGCGISSALMHAAEEAARTSGISLLVLDTIRDSAAESVYRHWGWQRAGEVPGYAATPDGVLHPTVYYFKVIAPLVSPVERR